MANQTPCWKDDRVVFSHCVSSSSVLFYTRQGQMMRTFNRKLAITDTQEDDGLGRLPPRNWKTLPESGWSWRNCSRLPGLASALVWLFGGEISAAGTPWLHDGPKRRCTQHVVTEMDAGRKDLQL